MKNEVNFKANNTDQFTSVHSQQQKFIYNKKYSNSSNFALISDCGIELI